MKFDELNILRDYYFEPMAISADDKQRRRELADLLTDAFLYFFSVFEVHKQYNRVLEKALYEQLLADRIADAVAKVTGIDGYISNHIRTLAKEVVDTTYRHADIKKDRQTPLFILKEQQTALENQEPLGSPSMPSGSPVHDIFEKEGEDDIEQMMGEETNDDDGYWLSLKRAMNIAYNETNTFLNYTDYVDAKEQGRTKKTWLTMLDDKVRDTHEEMEGQTVGIDEFFTVGNSLMKFPHDLSEGPDPKEIINCRCAVEYK